MLHNVLNASRLRKKFVKISRSLNLKDRFLLAKKTTFFLLLDDPTEPDLTIHPPSYLVSVEYNPKDPNILAGGCYNGQVSIHSFWFLPNFITNLPISFSYV